MTPSSEKTSEWVKDNDSRVTRVGRILRKFRLDELPQFVNILAGQMSLIGPRPHPVTNAGLFFDEIPYYLVRSKVRPGVTGWAQIRFGYANDLDEETEKMRYDLYYIKHRSVLFDMRILFETIWIVLFGRGSEKTTEVSDYRISQENRREHEYGWQTTYKEAFKTSHSVAQRSALSAQRSAWFHRIADPTDLSFYSAEERNVIASAIRNQLGYDPLVETRNRRRLDDNPLAPWELRTDRYRIFYEAEEDSREVTVVAVGHKYGNRLFLRGEEVLL